MTEKILPADRLLATNTKAAFARAFVRSLNILLKFVRLYGLDHVRSAEQFQTAWKELQAGIAGNEGGLLLSASGTRLLLDGTPMESSPAERSFAQMLSAAGLASIQFLPQMTREDLDRFVRAFPAGHSKPTSLGEQLKKALAGVKGVRINEIRFVEESAAGSGGGAGGQLASALMSGTIGANAGLLQDWLNDPQKLLQLIAAAEGSRGSSGAAGSGTGGASSAGTGTGSGTGAGSGSGGGTGSASGSAGGGGGGTGGATGNRGAGAVGEQGSSGSAGTGGASYYSGQGSGGAEGSGGSGDSEFGVRDQEVLNVLRLLSRLGQTASGGEGFGPGPLQQELENLSESPRGLLREALASLAAQAPTVKSNDPMLLRLAEHLAIRFALDRYERGEVQVSAVRQMLDRMSQEIGTLRKILGTHEETMSQAGIAVESHQDLLDRKFWASVPDRNKQAVLSSPEAWCIPPRNLRQYVEELLGRGDHALATSILDNYASALRREDPAARRRAAIGLAELADLYAAGEAPSLAPAIRLAGLQLSVEREAELQELIAAAFVRLSQEAANRRRYRAVLQSLDSLDSVENQRLAAAQSLRSRLNLEKRLPDFVEEAVRTAPNQPDGLMTLVARLPRPAAEYLMIRFNRGGQRAEREALVQVVQQLGPEGTACLREVLQTGQPNEAAEVLALLSRLDAPAVEQWLGERFREWPRLAQDRALRLLAASGAPERGALLLSLFDQFDALLQPLALDEISMSGEPSAGKVFMRLAAGQLPPGSTPFLRLKAVEGLGRLRTAEACELLREIVEAKKMWRWVHPAELRLTTLQALLAISPPLAESLLPHSGFTAEDLIVGAHNASDDSPWLRQRRYARVPLAVPIPASAASEQETVFLRVRGLSLGGGLCSGDKHLAPGTLVSLRLGTGLHPIRARAFMRGARAQAISFEFADMDLEERARLRRLLRENAAAAAGLRRRQNPSDEPALTNAKS